jgi:hypothetical protein
LHQHRQPQDPRLTSLSSTIFACVRASSLGLAVSDLSWVYCWAAIWGDIELGFGILGAVSLPVTTIIRTHKTNTLNPQNLALSRTYYEFFKRGLDTFSSRTGGTDYFPPPNRASYALHSVSKGSTNKKDSRNANSNSNSNSNNKNSNKSSSSSSSNPLSASTLTNNTSTTWDGSQALNNNKSSQVQIHGRRRRNSTGSASGDSDEVPLGKDVGLGSFATMGVNGGIEKKIEFSVEEEADARTRSAGGCGGGGGGGCGQTKGWGRDLERDGASEGDAREVRAGRGF